MTKGDEGDSQMEESKERETEIGGTMEWRQTEMEGDARKDGRRIKVRNLKGWTEIGETRTKR